MPGTVYLVGAGPGDPDLLTVKAQNLLRQCGALVYDSLVPNEILELVNESCKCVFVGKRRGNHSVSQVKTNDVLVELVKSHKCVVRLKGGDPFVFGRGGEEAEYLHRHGIDIEIVPGVTSGIAAAAYMGIPLTHRSGCSSVTFVTGHEGFKKQHPSVNWKNLATSTDSLVIYMGVYNIEYIVEELMAGGLPPETSAAVIQQATVKGQRFFITILKDLVYRVKKENIESPSIVMIGSVVDFQVKECAPKASEVTMPISF